MSLIHAAIDQALTGDTQLLEYVQSGKDIPVALVEPLMASYHSDISDELLTNPDQLIEKHAQLQFKKVDSGLTVSGHINDLMLKVISLAHNLPGESFVKQHIVRTVQTITGSSAIEISNFTSHASNDEPVLVKPIVEQALMQPVVETPNEYGFDLSVLDEPLMVDDLIIDEPLMGDLSPELDHSLPEVEQVASENESSVSESQSAVQSALKDLFNTLKEGIREHQLDRYMTLNI